MADKAPKDRVFSEEFLKDLFYTCLDEESCALPLISKHFKAEYMPDRASKAVLKALVEHYKHFKTRPCRSLVIERLNDQPHAKKFFDQCMDEGVWLKNEECIKYIESFMKYKELQLAFNKAQQQFTSSNVEQGTKELRDFIDWSNKFSLSAPPTYTDIIATFSSRHAENHEKANSTDEVNAITKFYIQELDDVNKGRDLRTQFTCILAPTGVGKSHAARWIGSQACLHGLNVLHFQLEGSREEVENAYSAALVNCHAYHYEKGDIYGDVFAECERKLKKVEGKLFVRSYPKFGMNVSTMDIKEAITEFKKDYNLPLDVVVIDSMNLLTDCSRGQDVKDERNKRLKVANDLRDLATEEKVWMVVTYQSTFEHPDWINDEKNVLTEYNCGEAKGISQPLTHLITLNQTAQERREKTMRLHVAKSRFFPKGDTFKIATNYDYEQFYDAVRTKNLKANDN